jgi:hypothetical protein
MPRNSPSQKDSHLGGFVFVVIKFQASRHWRARQMLLQLAVMWVFVALAVVDLQFDCQIHSVVGCSNIGTLRHPQVRCFVFRK